MKLKKIKKLYYSIGEVSDITGIKQYVLRYWETEFPILNPSKNRAGNRTYKDIDIESINLIKDLLYSKKFTIKGAKQYLLDQAKTKHEMPDNVVSINNQIDIKYLEDIKAQLEEAMKLIQKLKN